MISIMNEFFNFCLYFFFSLFFYLVFNVVVAEKPILKANCNNYQIDVKNFCTTHQIQDECLKLINVVQERCLSWSNSGDGNGGIVEIPIELQSSSTCIFQIVVDNIPHCVIDREDSKLLVHDDKPEIIASKTCQKFNMNENDCSTLANAAKMHLNQLIVERIQVAHRDSGIMSHNGSNPFLINLQNNNYNNVPHTNALLIMDKWRVKSKLSQTKLDDIEEMNDDNVLFPNFSVQLVNGVKNINRSDNRIYVKHTIKLMIKFNKTKMKKYDNIYTCFHINSPYKSSFYTSNGLDLGCESLTEMESINEYMFQIQNIPYGAHDIYVYMLNFSDPFKATRPMLERKVYVHVIPFLLPITTSSENYNGQLQNYKTCKKLKYLEMLPLRKTKKNSALSFSICILAHRGRNALRKALDSWEKSGLLNLAEEKILFLQELKDIESDERLNGDILKKYGLKIVGEEEQVGISKGLLTLVESSTAEYILFLEEDFRISDSLLNLKSIDELRNNVEIQMRKSIDLLQNERANVVRLRRRDMPGIPNCAFAWKNSEYLLGNEQTPMLNNQTLLDVHFWRNDLPKYFSNIAWRCGMSSDDEAEKYHCAFSTHASWTNNPILFSKRWFLKHIAPAALNDHSTRLEAAISFSPPLWNNKCFIVAHGNGLFMHDDIDKPQWEQTVCPGPPKLPTWWIAKDREKMDL